MTEGGKFRVVGYVSRKFIPQSRKCAFLTVEYLGDRGRKVTQEMVAFDGALIEAIDNIGQGESVDARGDLSREALKDKGKADVQVNGRPVFVTKLRLLAIDVLERKAPPPLEDDAITSGNQGELPRDSRLPGGW